MMLRTKRLLLREPRLSDLDAMFAVYSDAEAMRYWSTVPHAEPSVTKAMLEYRIAAWDRAPRNFQIEMDGEYIGNAGNFEGEEVGFMLRRSHWRQGIVREAMETIIPYLWRTTPHPRLIADVDPRNAASCGLLRALGFQESYFERDTFLIDGRWSDSQYFELTRPIGA